MTGLIFTAFCFGFAGLVFTYMGQIQEVILCAIMVQVVGLRLDLRRKP